MKTYKEKGTRFFIGAGALLGMAATGNVGNAAFAMYNPNAWFRLVTHNKQCYTSEQMNFVIISMWFDV